MKKYSTFLLSILFLLAGMSAAAQAPAVINYNPAEGGTIAVDNHRLELTFDMLVKLGAGEILVMGDAETMPIDVFVEDEPANVFIEEGTTVVIMNQDSWIAGEHYTVMIDEGAITSMSGTPSDYIEWAFNIQTQAQPPSVSVYDPVETIPGTPTVPVVGNFKLTFDQNINFGTGSTLRYIRIHRQDGSIFKSYMIRNGSAKPTGVTISGSELTIAHAPLAYSTKYYVTISAEAIISNDNSALAFEGIAANEWSFTTENPPAAEPDINDMFPFHEDINISLNPALSITFDIPVEFSGTGTIGVYKTLNPAVKNEFMIWNGSSTSPNVNISSDQLTLTITPSIVNELNTDYHVVIPSGIIKSTDGVPFSGFAAGEWQFKTVESIPSPPVPVENGYTPAKTGATGIPSNQIILLEFDKPVKLGTSGSVAVLSSSHNALMTALPNSNGLNIIGNNNNTLQITPSSPLQEGQVYQVLIANGAILSLNDNEPFAGVGINEWTFSTSEPLNIAATNPFNPAAGELNVATNQTLTVTFNQNIGWGTGVIKIWEEGNPTPTDYTVMGTMTPSLAPDLSINNAQLSISHSDFKNNTTYYVTIGNGAIVSANGTSSYAGLTSTATTGWFFKTEPLALSMESTDPANGTTVPVIPTSISATFNQDIQFGNGYIKIYDTANTANPIEILIEEDESASSADITGNVLTVSGSGLTFTGGHQYYVTIDAGAIESASGVSFEGIINASDWSFSVAGAPVIPTLSQLTPLNNSSGVDVLAPFKMKFNDNIQRGDGGSIRIKKVTGATSTDIQTISFSDANNLVFSGDSLTINHIPLESGCKYAITVGGKVIQSLTGDYFQGWNTNITQWSFTTLPAAAPPVVIENGYDPICNAMDVEFDKTALNLTFDQPVELSELGEYIYIKEYNSNETFISYMVEGVESDQKLEISLQTPHVLTLHVDLNFDAGTKYYVQIPNGAIVSKDSGLPYEGLGLGVDKDDWTFTTVPATPALQWDAGNFPTIPNQDTTDKILRLRAKFNTEETGTYYYMFSTNSTAPAANEIENGTSAAIHGSKPFTGDSIINVDINTSTLSPGADYFIYSVGISENTSYSEVRQTTFKSFMDVTFSPENLSSGIEVDITPTVQFSEPIYDGNGNQFTASGLSGHIQLKKVAAPEVPITCTLDYSNNTVTIHTQLEGDTEYLIEVSDVSDGDNRLYNQSATFRTVDNIQPSFTVTPESGTIDISTIVNITVTFSEAVRYIDDTPIESNPNGMVVSFNDDNSEPFDGYTVAYDAVNHILTISATDLEYETGYEIILSDFEDWSNNEYGDTTTLNYTTKANETYQWTGEGDTSDWNDTTNWEGGNIPNLGEEDILIPANVVQFPEITTATTVNNITIEAGALLTHSSGSFTVNGLFRLQSTPEVNASFIKTGGNLTVAPENVRIEQVMNQAATQTYIISSPVAGATASLCDLGMFAFDNSTGGYAKVVGELQPGIGYMARGNNPLVSFSGAINDAASYNVPVYYSSKGFGWNLVGNPYPAALDWDLLGRENIENSFWMWKHSENQYGVFGGTSGVYVNLSGPEIPSNHGFLVKVIEDDFETDGAASITFHKDAIVKNTTTYLRSSEAKQVLPHIKVAGINEQYTDETALIFSEAATEDMDPFDVEKYFSNNANFIELYTYAANMKSAINGLPYTDEMEIPLCFSVKKTGNFSIKLTANHTEALNVILIDKNMDNQEIDITEGEEYSFSVTETGQNESRFALKFKGENVNISYSETQKSDVKIFTKDKTVFVDVPVMKENRIGYSLFDINGRLINDGFLTSGTLNKIEVSTSGIYVLFIKGTEYLNNYKVIIK